ncbi:SAM-dependent methyltransferase [Treponema sp. HNW]|uniref:class I SAM-dependent methyltransferase n=1 Tax=Treponema sp. HNW TaxID=3116654 RepID=UPI003D0D1ABB
MRHKIPETSIIGQIPLDYTSAVLSNPLKKGSCAGIKDCIRVRIRKMPDGRFFAEFFTDTQVFHRSFDSERLCSFLQNIPRTDEVLWRQCLFIGTEQEVRILTNKKGKSTVLTKSIAAAAEKVQKQSFGLNRQKDYIIGENRPVPFLIALGIMNEQGKVFAKKYAKFRQINRFLEFIDDILPCLSADGAGTERPLSVIDFGCGKSYLTFAAYHFLTDIKGLKAEIVGLDLKADVIEHCRTLSRDLDWGGLDFQVRDVRSYEAAGTKPVDMVIALHACDTATDYAIAFALKHRARAILSVPCCQHELNAKLSSGGTSQAFKALMRYGIIKERFCALATDVMRAELIKKTGYEVDICEFIDTEHTPKNLLIRAVRRKKGAVPNVRNDSSYEDLCSALGTRITLEKLID